MSDVSTFRLYALRAMYLFMAVGLALTRWPGILNPPPGISHSGTVVGSFLGALSLLALLGVRYPVRMLPLLFFELLWKVLWVLGWGLPLWSAGQLSPDGEQTLISCLVGVVLVPLAIPWGHALRQYVLAPGERWGRRSSTTAQTTVDDVFGRDATGVDAAAETAVVDLSDGDTFELVAAPVRKRIGDAEVRLLGYNGAVPGPTLRVRQGATVTVNFTNRIDLESTVHWHGLRLANRDDGTHETQAPVPVGGSFAYRVHCPDPGVYWYHPHIREDYGQELGLYGTILVAPAEAGYWPPAHRELALTLDDILLEDGRVAPFRRSQTTHTAMGRFGNVLLVNGEPDLALTARRGEVVRLCLTNTANTRVFNVRLPGARMKLVGGDSGRCEREEFAASVLLAPSERAVVDVLFDEAGTATLEHHTPARTYTLATVAVSEERATPSLAEAFAVLRSAPELVAERQRLAPYLVAAPDKTLAFVAEMNLGDPDGADNAVVYACPMHPEVVGREPGRCPKCGMKLLATMAPAVATYACPMHPDVISDAPGSCPTCGMKLLPADLVEQAGHGSPQPTRLGRGAGAGQDRAPDHGGHEHGATAGIEWEDDMVAVNRMTTPDNMRWLLVDRATGAANHGIDWGFRVGERVKIRLVNELASDHPMHHPFHIHGAGRFLVLSRGGVAEPNLAWKDTVLVRTGETVDILLEVTNPGVWMAHCHIAEHHESGMMLTFRVAA
jgi:FtsP/CotA-like multicopper oxidase with cupredoxin domain